ncbi:MAG: DoxX family protein [Mycobacterium sp.]
MLLRRVARPLLSATFIGQGLETLRNPDAAANAVRPGLEYLRRIPDSAIGNLPDNAKRVALVNAAVQIGAGVLLATGKLPRLASAALAATVVPGNLGTHMFWTEDDPERHAEKRRAFLADVSLLGGLIIASADTEGRPSLGWRGRQAAERFAETVSSTMRGDASHPWHDSELGDRLTHGLRSAAEHGRELAATAGENSGPLLEAALKRGTELAETARDRGTELAEATRDQGSILVKTARRRSRGPRKRFAAARKHW